MTTSVQGAEIVISKPAGADLSALQYYFVKESTGTIVACTAATDRPLGVLQNKPDTAGLNAEVLVLGGSKCNANGAITEGDLIGPAADGQADPKIPGTDTTEYLCGLAVSAAAGAGEIFSALINCVNPARGA